MRVFFETTFLTVARSHTFDSFEFISNLHVVGAVKRQKNIHEKIGGHSTLFFCFFWVGYMTYNKITLFFVIAAHTYTMAGSSVGSSCRKQLVAVTGMFAK